MSKKQTQNVGMVDTLPSAFELPGGFHVPTGDGAEFANRVAILAAHIGFAPKGLFYAIQYGLSQSLQDSIAGMAKKLDTATEADGETPKYSAVEKSVMIHDALKERLDAIMTGDIGHRVQGPRVKGIDKVIHEVSWETIVAAATGLGKASLLPKKASDIAAMVAKYLDVPANAEAARAEAERRMAAAKPVDTSFLDGLV